jgi:hypothetical protein
MLNAYGSFQVPENARIEVEVDSSGNPIYIGRAEFGSSTSDSEWLIYKLTWVNGSASKSTAVGPWDSRTILVYI